MPRRDLPEDEVIGLDERGAAERVLGDFTTSSAVLRVAALALPVGAAAACVALLLLKAIALATNLSYQQRLAVTDASPAANTLGWLALLVPVAGGLLGGVIARFGSERIRGHGIPEAMETILVGGSKAEPRVAVLKPLSSAISIGTGGPFGAEGPIILTGGAFGSVIGQFFRLSAIERRSLLVAGSAAGMSAVFGTPVAAAFLGVELLLFEWRPRSMVPVALASGVAAVVRARFVAAGWLAGLPLFGSDTTFGPSAMRLGGVVVVGVAAGGAAWVLTRLVYATEDAFKKLPVHWMWWPAIGGAVVGLGGLIQPRALGVGYDVIGDGIGGRLLVGTLVSILVVKLVIWAVALGSGTSGGILAPILIVGVCLGGLLGSVLPGPSGAWAIVGMSAVMAGVMRSPFTAIVFGFELTLNAEMLLPLLFACTAAHLISVLTLKRSILTEKVARRGFHVLREYGVGPLEAIFVREVMDRDVLTIASDVRLADAYRLMTQRPELRRQRVLSVVVDDGEIVGVVPWTTVLDHVARRDLDHDAEEVMVRRPVVAYPDETLRDVADRMTTKKVGVLPVVERGSRPRLVGIITQFDLLAARERMLDEERHRERVLLPALRRRAEGRSARDS